MTETISITETEISIGNENLRQFYAYADDKSKTWFISAAKRAPYKGLILLFILGCTGTNKPIHQPDKSCPVVGTVLTSVNGERLEVRECEWA